MLPLTGEITTYMIATEFGLSTNLEVQLILQRVGGILQVKIGGIWRNLNMCSPYLPKEIPECAIQDWYGYNHSAIGVTSVTILGETTILNGSTHTYTAQLQGNNFAGITYQWEKYENSAWTSLGTASTQEITWANVTGAKVKVTISNTCGGNNVSSEANLNLACTAPSSVIISGNWGVSYNGQYQYNLVSWAGTTVHSVIEWEVGTYGSIISGQGTSQINVQFDFNSGGVYDANRTCTIKCKITNDCGNAYSNNIDVTPNVYGNVARSQDFIKECGVGYQGTTHTYTVPINTYYWYTLDQANALAQNDIDENGQIYANNQGQCNFICVPPSSVTITGDNSVLVSHQNYSVTFDGTSNGLVYLWEVEGCTIVSGQGTATLTVLISPTTDPNVTRPQYNAVRCKVTNGCDNSWSAWYYINVEFVGNDEYSENFTKDNCEANQTGSTHTYTLAADSIWEINKATANANAVIYVQNNGQAWVNVLQGATCIDNCIPIVFDPNTSFKFNGGDIFSPTNGQTFTISANITTGSNITYSWIITNNQDSSSVTGNNSSIVLTTSSSNINNRAYTILLEVSNDCTSTVYKEYTLYIQIYGNDSITREYTKNNCSSNQYPALSTNYTYNENRVYAFTKNDANALASIEIDIEGQNFANNGTCICKDVNISSAYLLHNTIGSYQNPTVVIELDYPENITRIDYIRTSYLTFPFNVYNRTYAPFSIVGGKIHIDVLGFSSPFFTTYTIHDVKLYNCNGGSITLNNTFNVYAVDVDIDPQDTDIDRQGDSGNFNLYAVVSGNGLNEPLEYSWQIYKVSGAGSITPSTSTSSSPTLSYSGTTWLGELVIYANVTILINGREVTYRGKEYSI